MITGVRASAGGGVLDDEVRWGALAGELSLVEAIAGLLKGVGKVERLGELGVEESPGTEAWLHNQKPWRALGVVGEHEEAAQRAVVIRVRGGRGPFAAAGGERAERRGGRGEEVAVRVGVETEASADAGDGGAEHRGRRWRAGGAGGCSRAVLGPPVRRSVFASLVGPEPLAR